MKCAAAVLVGWSGLLCAWHGQALAQRAGTPSLRSENPVPQGSPLPGIARPITPSVGAPPVLAPAAPAEISQARSFAFASVAVEGVSAYPPAAFAPITAGLTGAAVSLTQVEAARTAIVNKYRADGYVYTAVNARIVGTRLHLVVTEGRIVDVKLDGDIGPAGAQVLRFLRRLTRISPITTAALERALLLASDVPGVTVHGVINPSSDDPGALTLVAQVARQAFAGQVQADNRAFRQTGPEELLSVLDLNSFTSLGESTQLSIYHTFNNTNTFGQGVEDFFIGGSGLRAHLYGGIGDSDPSGSLRALGYHGITRVFGASLSYPVIRSRQQTLTVSGLFDGLESEILLRTTGVRQRNSFDSLRVLRADAQDVFYDTLFGPRSDASDFVNLRLSQGIDALGATHSSDTGLARRNEQTGFTSVNGEIDRTQTLFPLGPFATVSFKAAAAGQFSRDVLPPAEKLYLGGPHFNRGFYYGEVTGDKAATATAEPLLDAPLPDVAFLPKPLRAQFYTFYDWGEVWQNQALDLDHVLRSTGGGLRMFVGERAEIDVEGVYRLTRTPDGSPPQVSELKRAALYWQVVGRF